MNEAKRVMPAHMMEAYRVMDAHQGVEHHGRPPREELHWPAWTRPLAASGALLDRGLLRVMEGIFLSSERRHSADETKVWLKRVQETYATPVLLDTPARFFRPTEALGVFALKRLSRLPGGGSRFRLNFPSAYKTYDPDYQAEYNAYTENQDNWVHIWRHRDPGRPTVILVHAWCSGQLPLEERIFSAATLYKWGLNVALFTLPFHGRRTPAQARFSGQLFPSRHFQRNNEAFGQAISDLRILIRWLREEFKVGPIGVAGLSLGGYTSALLASLEPMAFAIPIVAVSSLPDLMWSHGRGRPGRAHIEGGGVDLWDLRASSAVHCPLLLSPKLPHERRLVIWGEGDHIVPSVHQLALWEHWDRPRVLSFPGGHLLQFGRSRYFRKIRAWLKELEVL